MYSHDIDFTNLICKEWLDVIDKNILEKTNNRLINLINKNEIYPFDINDIFKIFNLVKLNDIKVVILGQDPYYANKEQANGIAFSVNKHIIKIPPSLKNIFKELGNTSLIDGDLSPWVKQGVFLLNSSLTVESNKPNSHLYIWQEFILHIISIINEKCTHVIFVSWGNSAKEKYKNIDTSKHIILESSHPSPLSAYKTDKPFIGSDVFNKINNILKKQNHKEIIW